MQKAMDTIGYTGTAGRSRRSGRRSSAAKRAKCMGIGISFSPRSSAPGRSKNCDILGIGMFDSCEIRIHPTGSAIARLGTKPGAGARDDLRADHRHRNRHSRRRHHDRGRQHRHRALRPRHLRLALDAGGGRRDAMAARKIRAKAQMIAAYMLEVHDDDVEWDVDRFQVKGAPEKFKTMKEIAFAAYNQAIPNMEPGLEAVSYYDPPNMTYPFGAYFCVMDIDVDTGVAKIRQFYALDDCGTRINPMIIEGQVHGGLTEALASPWVRRSPMTSMAM
jgi:carbon-monoxide dehydrogenase large subunit